ncbi:EpsG family protein [Ornithobacterium rhinotracheale]|uniref:EpsG family protein n=1 Tax=Ornithobacterium rhinotracheale TaxID=28251 RepID=UPI00129D2212|nr:EpsG family protein [Ornithobacterium rhinotracheale]MRJ07598.1 EpsG family protein [Ornithobacterium rhinotracheale]UOH78197.1 EpsG family protein [Ornithobacterium rhinotracheale]
MLFYLLCFALIILLPFFKNKGYTLAALFSLAFIAGVRDMIGSRDMYYYAYFFEQFSFKDLWYFDFYEPGFKAHTILLKAISSQREFYFFITAFVLIFLQSFAVKKMNLGQLSYWVVFMVLCKFYLLDFVYLRQLMATGLAWIAFAHYFGTGKKWQSFALFVFAAFFHRSALILLPLFFVLNLKNNLKIVFWIYAALTTVVIFQWITPISQKFFTGIGLYFPYLDRLKYYAFESAELKYLYLLEIPLVLAVLYFIPKLKSINSLQQKILFNAVFLYGFFSIFSISNATFIRMAWFYFLGLASAIALIVNYFSHSDIKNYIKIGILVYFSAIFFRILISFDGGDFIPYKSIFNEFKRNGQFEMYEYRQ